MKNKNDGNPIDKMIQANKDEADSMLSLWGMKKRKQIKTKKVGRSRLPTFCKRRYCKRGFRTEVQTAYPSALGCKPS